MKEEVTGSPSPCAHRIALRFTVGRNSRPAGWLHKRPRVPTGVSLQGPSLPCFGSFAPHSLAL